MKKHLQVFFVLIIYCFIFCIDDVSAYSFGLGTYYVQMFEGNTYKGEAHNPNQYLGYSQFRVNATSDVNTIRGIWESGNVDLSTTGFNNYDLTVFDFKIYNNSLSAGVEPITSIQAWNGNTCYYTSTRFSYVDQESMQVSAICPGPVPTTFGNLQPVFTINFASFTPSTIDVSAISVNATNGQVENYLNSINSQLLISNQTLTNIYNILSSQGQQGVINAINNQTQQQQQQNQIVNNTDSSGNASDFNSVVNNATLPNSSHGFDILGSLQIFISGINVSGSCNRISVPIPFTNQTLTLPCMTTDVYSVHFPEIVVIWQLIVRGLGYYYILVNILKLIKETIDPFNFKLEVMDL